ncbi:hypothetical protein [Nocardia bovistercoris]|uniref:DUF11 domain-containing protein n=1 Tax=Nocardia bovistercoris TaxID=2785916 RepID=A0A931I918_9NOCA|nr:hypothetical protein [Nocardia bovistercoris]MBH0776326.1 hypothetical protein [Nocardia bovistercoris]
MFGRRARRARFAVPALLALALAPLPSPALAATPPPDVKIEIVGLDPNDNSKVLLRATNVGPSWSQNTSVQLETIPPQAGATVTLPVDNLNVPGSPDYNKNDRYYDEVDDIVYSLKAPCLPGVKVRATLATAKAYDGTPETNLADNTAEREPCPAAGNADAGMAPLEAKPGAPADRPRPVPNLAPFSVPITLPTTGQAPTPAAPDSTSPGQHTLTLGVRMSRFAAQSNIFSDFWGGCGRYGPFPGPLRGQVGFANTELPDGSRCGAVNLQVALSFDDGPLRQITSLRIDTATLTYDESPGASCPLVTGQVTPCWSGGSGRPEHKPNGCVEIELPTVDWINSPPPGLISYSTNPKPTTKRLDPRTWDVTEPFSWQLNPRNRPLTPPGAPDAPSGFGFLMAGAIHIDQLDGNDNTVCISQVSNARLHITYTVFPDGRPPVVK